MSLGVLKEWSCLEHGEFESSHPICPEHGCKSKFVQRVFLTAPKIRSRMVTQFDRGIKRTADLMKLRDLKTARAGEMAHPGVEAPVGSKVLWGDECRQVFGRGFGELMGVAQKPLSVQTRGGETLTLNRNNGMADAATDAGLTQARFLNKPLPAPADNAAARSDRKSMRALGQKV
jgi:hypothetical protein